MNFAKTALDLFYKTFGRRILKTAADNKWVVNMIQKLKSKHLKSKAPAPKTSDVVKKVREGLRADKPFQGFKPTIVPKGVKPRVVKPRVVEPKKIVPKKPDTLKDILQGKPHIDKQGRSWEFQKVPHPKGPAKIIPFPKKPPGKADGGRIDKALPGRSRDI